MVTLPSDISTGVGLTATMASGICLRNSFSSLTKILKDPEKNALEPQTFLQGTLQRLLGKSPSTVSSMARNFSEGIFWGVSSVAFAALAMLALDPGGKHTPSQKLQAYLPLKQGPALFSEDFAARFNPLSYEGSFVKGLGEGVQTLAKSIHSFVSFLLPPKVLPKPLPTWTSAPFEKAKHELKNLSLNDVTSLLPWGAFMYLAWANRQVRGQLNALSGKIQTLNNPQFRDWVSVSDSAAGARLSSRGSTPAPPIQQNYVLVQEPGAATENVRPGSRSSLGSHHSVVSLRGIGGSSGDSAASHGSWDLLRDATDSPTVNALVDLPVPPKN